jgi:large subunit ribosomal protein L21
MSYAVVRIGGKQFRVEEGDKIEVTRQKAPYKVDVLYCSTENQVYVGAPVLTNITVKTKLVEDKLGDKVRVARFRSKSRYRKVKGHRQPLSVLEVTKIVEGKASAKVASAPEKAGKDVSNTARKSSGSSSSKAVGVDSNTKEKDFTKPRKPKKNVTKANAKSKSNSASGRKSTKKEISPVKSKEAKSKK